MLTDKLSSPTVVQMSSQGMKCAPPVFSEENSYERLLMTNVKNKKEAITVALSLPKASEVRQIFFVK